MKKIISLVILVCMLLSVMSFGVSADGWRDSWSIVGGSPVFTSDGFIQMTSTASNVPVIKGPMTINNGKFDVEFTIDFKSKEGKGEIQLRTGKQRIYFIFEGSNLVWRSGEFATTNKYTYYPYNFELGEHRYRFIGDNSSDYGSFDLFIDDYYITTFDAEKNIDAPYIQIANRNGFDWTIKNVQYRSVSASESEGDASEEVIEPVGFVNTFDSGEDVSDWELSEGTWSIHDGVLKSEHTSSTAQYAIKRNVYFGEDFTLKARFRFMGYTHSDTVQIYYPGHALRFHPKEDHLEIWAEGPLDGAKYSSEEISLGNDWHDWVIETYNSGDYCRIYVDDVQIAEFPVRKKSFGPPWGNTITLQSLCAGTDRSDWEVDYISLEPKKSTGIVINPLIENAEYLEGESVFLSASLQDGTDVDDVPQVEYKQFGKTVAIGLAPEYKAELKNVRAGAYSVKAEYGNISSNELNYTVRPRVSGSFQVVENKEDDIVEICLSDTLEQIDSVEYLVDGQRVAVSSNVPYSIMLEPFGAGKHMLSAICRNSDGIVLDVITEEYEVKSENRSDYTGYSNEITYQISGASGSATVEQSNGRHLLSLNHTDNGIVYQTDEGTQSYSGGSGIGRYTVLTDGPYAEVYRNGQFAFGFIMPRSKAVEHKKLENGLSINDYKVSVPEKRRNYFKGQAVTGKKTYMLPGLSYVHNIDFLASADDNARIALDDGYFRTEISLRDGKIYAVNSELDRSLPREIYLADIPKSDTDLYFRIKTSAGMSELYADGQYLSTFRGVSSAGSETLNVNVSAGVLPYLSVCDATDIYIYSDDFKQSGAFSSENYWRMDGIDSFIDRQNGFMTMIGKGTNLDYAELNVSAGEAYAEADISVKEGNGGVWMLYNHNSTNMYSKAGYNFETGMFEIVDNMAGTITTKTAQGTLPVGDTVKLALQLSRSENGKIVTLYMNGVPVISTESNVAHNGRIGVAVKDATIYLERFAYRGDSKPMLNVNERMPGGIPSMDMFETEDEIVLINDANRMRSSDGGKTWTPQSRKEYDSTNVIRLQSGELLSIYREYVSTAENGLNNYDFKAMVSYDDGETWTLQSTQSVISDEQNFPGFNIMPNRIRQGPSGRIYLSADADPGVGNINENYGATRLVYSDDKGKTWTTSETRLGTLETGLTPQEATTMELPDGTVRTYARTDRGYLVYFESKDGGKTFDVTPHKLPFTSVLCAFNVDYDPEDSNTWYLTWVYDNANLDGRNQFRRQRVALAKSTDAGATWSYLGTVFEWNTDKIWKLNVMNTDVGVTRDYLEFTWWSQEDLNTDYISRIITIKKDTLQPTKRFEQLHTSNAHSIDVVNPVIPFKKDRTMLINETDHRAVLRGMKIENAAYDNKILLACAAAYVGAETENDGNGNVALKTGTSTVSFNSGDIAVYGGRVFVSVDAFAREYGLTVESEGDTKIISAYSGWSPLQKNAFVYAAEGFVEETPSDSGADRTIAFVPGACIDGLQEDAIVTQNGLKIKKKHC